MYTYNQILEEQKTEGIIESVNNNANISLGPVYEFVCISFRTDNLNCFRAS